MRVALAVTWRRLAIVAFLAAGLFVAWKLTRFESTGWLARDFKLKAAQRLLDGETLYPSDGSGEYPYPPLWAMLVSPLLALPSIVAQYAASILCAIAIVAALRIVGVRDPFCLAAALISSPVVSAAQMGNASAFVALLLALTYRFNSAPAGIAIALKLYPWPVLIWSGIRRGWRDLMIGVCVAGAGILVPWALIGFDGIGRYLSVAHEITIDLTGPTYALPLAVSIPVTLAALAAMWVRRADPAGSFSFAVLAMLAATPVLWGFYFTAVLVPLGIQRPRLSIAWLIPFLAIGIRGDAHLVTMLGLLVWCGIGSPSIRVRLPRALLRADT